MPSATTMKAECPAAGGRVSVFSSTNDGSDMGLPNSPDGVSRQPSPIQSRSEFIGLATGMIAAIIWGTFLATTRAGVTAGFAASDLALLRSATAGTIMLPWLLANNALTCGGVGWGRAIVLTLLVGPPFILIGASGYTFAPLAHGAIIQPAALTLGSMVLAAMVLRERPTRMQLIGVGVILGGLVMIAGPDVMTSGSMSWRGDCMFAMAGTMWAIFSVLIKRWQIAPIAATAAVSVISAVAYVPIYLAFAHWDTLSAAPAGALAAQIVVQGILSAVVAAFAYARTVQIIGPTRAAIFPAVVPAIAMLVGVPVTGEIPTPLQLAGLGVVSVGLIIALNLVASAISKKADDAIV